MGIDTAISAIKIIIVILLAAMLVVAIVGLVTALQPQLTGIGTATGALNDTTSGQFKDSPSSTASAELSPTDVVAWASAIIAPIQYGGGGASGFSVWYAASKDWLLGLLGVLGIALFGWIAVSWVIRLFGNA